MPPLCVSLLDWLLALLLACPMPPVCELAGILLVVPPRLAADPDCALVSVCESRLFDGALASSMASLFFDAPLALPLASARVSRSDVAATVTAPAPLKLRLALASVSSVTMFSATDAPTATLSPAASAAAVVTTVSASVAAMRSSPLPTSAMALPLPTIARVVFSTMAMPIAAPTAVLSLDAPFWAVVRAALSASAVTMKWPALPLTASPSSISAMVLFSAMFSAIDAPTPTFEPFAPPPLGAASTMFSVRLAARMSTSPVVSTTVAALFGGLPSAL